MTTLREAGQQALRLIEDEGHKADLLEAASILRAALAEQAQPERGSGWCDIHQHYKQCEHNTAEQAQPVAELVARELERLAQDPPISGNTLAQARVLMAAASLRQFGLGGGASAPVAPSGWRMVPVEPTDAMVYAGKEQANKNAGGCRLARKAYSAMLAAAPEAPTPPAPQPLSGLDVERLLEDVVGSLPVARKLIRAVEAEVLKRMGVGK